jgi:hypothetical protein
MSEATHLIMSEAPPKEWNINLKIYPSFPEIVLTLQDVGSERQAKERGMRTPFMMCSILRMVAVQISHQNLLLC